MEREHEPTGLRKDALEELASLTLGVSRSWVIALAAAAAISTVHVDVGSAGHVSGGFRVDSLTVILLALVWLPALIKVLAIAGGRIKTPAGEASTPGLASVLYALTPERQRDALPPIVTALHEAELNAPSPEARRETEPLREQLEGLLAAVAPRGDGPRETLALYAERYERTRRELESGRERTMLMTSITTEARAAVRATPPSAADLRHMLDNGSPGERVVALAVLQDVPDGKLLPEVLSAVSQSLSAFEQYQAIAAAYELVPLLSRQQKTELCEVLELAMNDPTRAVGDDASRAKLANAILRQVRA